MVAWAATRGLAPISLGNVQRRADQLDGEGSLTGPGQPLLKERGGE